MTAEPLVGEGAPEPQLTYERGWHPDPADPKRERWHDGRGFTDHTHRALRKPSMFGADYDRSMWPGANVAAGRARRASDVASIVFGLLVIGVFLIPFVPWAFTAIGIGMLGLAMSSTAQVVLGVRGVRRAAIDGGLGMSIIVVAQGSIYLFISAAYLVLRLSITLGP